MKEVVLIFPGQGGQYVGMGAELNDSESLAIFEKANKVLGFDLKALMLNGPIENLTLTENAQPAILTHSYILLNRVKKILRAHNIKINATLGHSVGEYAALVAANALSFEDALSAVRARGSFMQASCPVGTGKMFAILKAPYEDVQAACDKSSNENSYVVPANFNAAVQTVISGHSDACHRAVDWLKENSKTRHMSIELNVSAPFHSPLMRNASEKLAAYFQEVKFSQSSIDYIANIDAKLYKEGTDALTIKNNLIKQVSSSVKWFQSIENLDSSAIFIEVGPGKVLAGLNRKINKDITTLSMDKNIDFEEKLLEAVK